MIFFIGAEVEQLTWEIEFVTHPMMAYVNIETLATVNSINAKNLTLYCRSSTGSSKAVIK